MERLMDKKVPIVVDPSLDHNGAGLATDDFRLQTNVSSMTARNDMDDASRVVELEGLLRVIPGHLSLGRSHWELSFRVGLAWRVRRMFARITLVLTSLRVFLWNPRCLFLMLLIL